jgi:hypothetical protein
MPVLDFKDRAAIAPKPLAWKFAGDAGPLFRIVVTFLVIYFLILEAVNPDQLPVSGNLQFEVRHALEIDLDPEDGHVAPTVAIGALSNSVAFFHIDGFTNGLR